MLINLLLIIVPLLGLEDNCRTGHAPLPLHFSRWFQQVRLHTTVFYSLAALSLSFVTVSVFAMQFHLLKSIKKPADTRKQEEARVLLQFSALFFLVSINVVEIMDLFLLHSSRGVRCTLQKHSCL